MYADGVGVMNSEQSGLEGKDRQAQETAKTASASQSSSPWATFGTIAAIVALAVSLGAFAEGLRRSSRPGIAAPSRPNTQTTSKTTTSAAPKSAAVASPKPTLSADRTNEPDNDEARRAKELKDLEEKMRETEAKRASLAATQNAIAQAASHEQLDMLATLYPELAPAIEIRRTTLAGDIRQQEEAANAAEAELATLKDPARIAEIGARWPALRPQVEARLASLKTEGEKKEPDPKVAALERMTRVAQDGLRRAGCFSGPSTGTWGPKTKKAVETFNTHAKAKIATDAPTEAAETILGAVKTRICPVACDAPKVAVDGKCLIVTCAEGTVPATGGACEQAFVAWVGSHESVGGAEALFASLQHKHTDLLRDRPSAIKAAASVQRFSVRIGPAMSKDTVRDLCAKLKSAGMAANCYPVPQ